MNVLPVDNSYAALSTANPSGRTPRAPNRQRPQAFHDAYDRKTLFYDCFWHADGQRVLLVGPPPYGLGYRKAAFVARPSGARLAPKFFPSLSTMITALAAPEGTTAIEVEMAGEHVSLPVQPNSSSLLAGKRLLFSINRDNELGWIREWACWHARLHGTDAIILFDNGSTTYSREELLETLHAVPGIAHAGVPSWPHSFGPIDPAVTADPYWARFLQIGSMSVLLRRYGEAAYGLLDCDIDELAGTRSGTSIYDLARQSRGGLVAFRGVWIEATHRGSRHRDYTERLAAPEAAESRQRKWALDPTRAWVRRLNVHPYWHWVRGRPLLGKSMPKDALYWHFKGINTNWKHARSAAPAGPTEKDPELVAALQRAGLVTLPAER